MSRDGRLDLDIGWVPERAKMGRALMPIGADCPACGAALETVEATEEPLLRHGGYGAARRTTTRLCSDPECRWWLTSEIGEVRPLGPAGTGSS